jgi:hypothetical protein
MPDARQVWMVRLRRGDTSEVAGTLNLLEEGLSFVPKDGSYDMRIPVTTIRRARRIRGSPVLVIRHEVANEVVETAFYFTQPPPMPRADSDPARTTGNPLRRKTKRKTMRKNAGYLTTMNATHKQDVAAWLSSIEERMGSA